MRETRRARAAEALAEKRFDDVRHLANSLLFEIHDQIRDLAGSTPARQMIVRRALEYLDSLSKERGGDAGLTLELASAYQRVGDVQGNPYQPNLGDTQGASGSYRKAIALLEPMARKNGPAHQEALAKALFSLGGLQLALGKPEEAVRFSGRALELERGIAAAAPGDLARGRALATGLRVHAYNLSAARRVPESLALLREQADLLNQLRAKAPADATLQRELAQNRYLVGTALARTGDALGAQAALLESVGLWRALLAANPSSPDLRRGLVFALADYSRLLPKSDPKAMLPYRQEAREVAAALVESDPKSADGRMLLAISETNLAACHRYLGDPESARSHWDAARALLEPLVEADRSNAWRANILANVYLSMAGARLDYGKGERDRSDACDLFRKTYEVLSRFPQSARTSFDESWKEAQEGLRACRLPAPSAAK